MRKIVLTIAALSAVLTPSLAGAQITRNELTETFRQTEGVRQSIFNRSAVNQIQPQLFKIAAPREFIQQLPRNWQGSFSYEDSSKTRYPLKLTITSYSIREKILSFRADLDYGQGTTRLNGFIDAQSGQVEMFDEDIELGVSKRLGGVSGKFVGFISSAFERDPALVSPQADASSSDFYWFPNQISQPSGVMTLKPVEAVGTSKAQPARNAVPNRSLTR